MTQDTTSTGFVYLVGAGPGDPSYITLRAAECLQQADVVLYDYLANPLILQHARPEAEKICLGRHGAGKLWEQQEINSELVRLAQQGLKIVRLKGGDPAIFARCAEETGHLDSHGIAYEIVPGITAALASGTCVGVPLTHREWASAVAFVTGSEQVGKQDSSLDFRALAAFPGTLVFYMGVTTAKKWTTELIRHGKSGDTPVVIVRRISCSDQVSVKCKLSEVIEKFSGAGRIRPPAIVIVGEVAGEATMNSWFEQRPLFGQTILVTRALGQAEDLVDKLVKLGADVLVQPAIEILPPESLTEVDAAIQAMSTFDWLVFSSSNGVRFFMDRLQELGLDGRHLSNVRIAAIGPNTAQALTERHLNCDLVPDAYRAEALGAAMSDLVTDKHVLLIRASRGRDTLCEILVEHGAQVTQVVTYLSQDVTEPDPQVSSALGQGEIQWVTITSSAIGRSTVALLGADLAKAKVVSISPITSGVLKELGVEIAVEAKIHSVDGMVDAILDVNS